MVAANVRIFVNINVYLLKKTITDFLFTLHIVIKNYDNLFNQLAISKLLYAVIV